MKNEEESQNKLLEAEEHLLEGRLYEAEEGFRKLLATNPSNPEVYNNLGVVFHARGNWHRAESYFQTAIGLDGCFLDASWNLAQLYKESNHWREATLLLEKYVGMNEEDPEVFNELAMVYLKTGEVNNAMWAFKESLKRNPEQDKICQYLRGIETGQAESNKLNGRMRDFSAEKIELPEDWIGPVVIGGVGGSGTRLMSRLIKLAGLYTGTAVNKSEDNLYFSNLFANPLRLMWSDDGKIDAQVIEAIRIFEKAMLCPERLSKRDLQCIIRYAFEVGHVMPLSNTTASTPYREWLSKVLSSMLDPKDIDYDKYLGWGWKEPCTYIYLRQLKQRFQSMKYIHVIRHGLDMAFSANETHLQNWSRFFGFQCPKEKELIPDAQLKFWNTANAYAAKTAKQILGTDFLLVRFEDICLETETALRQIFEFLGLELTNNVLDKFTKMVEVPPSLNRYKTKDISSLDPAQVSKIQEFGYRV